MSVKFVYILLYIQCLDHMTASRELDVANSTLTKVLKDLMYVCMYVYTCVCTHCPCIVHVYNYIYMYIINAMVWKQPVMQHIVLVNVW